MHLRVHLLVLMNINSKLAKDGDTNASTQTQQFHKQTYKVIDFKPRPLRCKSKTVVKRAWRHAVINLLPLLGAILIENNFMLKTEDSFKIVELN